MKFAIISDIHGNYPAMQLAIKDALLQGAEEFLFVGDLYFCPYTCAVVFADRKAPVY